MGHTPASMLFSTTPADTATWAGSRAQVTAAIEAALENALFQLEKGSVTDPLLEEVRRFVRRPGKRVRPLLLLNACRAFGGDATRALPVSASLELLHAFILAHDDVIDRSDVRSGRPTLHKALEGRLGGQGGRDRAAGALAVVLGDVLFAAAQQTIIRSAFAAETRLRVLDAVLGYLGDTGLGECEDVLFGLWDVSRLSSEEVERMYWLKTTRYSIECPLVVGAMLGGAGDGVVERLREISRPFGLCLQIQNDLKAFREFEVSDARIPEDFLEGKKTLLMTTAHELLEGGDRRLLQLCLGQQPVTDTALALIKELVVKSGAGKVLERRAGASMAEGCRLLDNSGLPQGVRDALSGTFLSLGTALDCPAQVSESVS